MKIFWLLNMAPIFRGNPLKRSISRNRMFTSLLSYSLRGSNLIQRIEAGLPLVPLSVHCTYIGTFA